MFPDSVGHMVVDGVIDATEYYHDPAEAEYISLADETFARANRRYNSSLNSMIGFTSSSIYHLGTVPVFNSGWPRTSLVLKGSYEGNVTQATALLQAGGSIAAGLSIAPEANLGIRAADRTARVHNLEEYQPYLDKILESSKIIGDISAYAQMAVLQWNSSAIEVYNGDFRVKTKTGVLVASNTSDPLAPLAAGKRLSGLVEGSSLLINNGCGHTVLSQASICTIKHIRAYFVSDVLPTTNTVCEPDIPLFSTNITLADILTKSEAEPQ
ncbi:hypothetical protein BDU57DRAFT_534940 [Ampelomyces quisqualis]|uniref:Peptidase S33 tripeptidyl aminopeptidase-like C-terminal domain-containing protein n=1 Tax=Ampelomyces quisqualis TaxID=50730 RepID=A0A6A5R2M9_AMPQU|nr:hypothetical protein BDU57DRAFT_534940 [Ampelomyces quisqualis]